MHQPASQCTCNAWDTQHFPSFLAVSSIDLSMRVLKAAYTAVRASLKWPQRWSSLYSSPFAAYSKIRYTRLWYPRTGQRRIWSFDWAMPGGAVWYQLRMRVAIG